MVGLLCAVSNLPTVLTAMPKASNEASKQSGGLFSCEDGPAGPGRAGAKRLRGVSDGSGALYHAARN